ncbi:MAG TPA: outer membrane protein transport protein [Polyangiaceae bacterium]|nr:outer membrane protein transport protein [Polyangiaceae bacterium]
MRRLLVVVAGVAALAVSADARANPLDAFGFGSRETAMGGAVAADVSDFSASYYNPAGLAKARGFEMSIGYFRADHFLQMNGSSSGVDPVKGVVGGAVVPGKVYGLPFAVGVGLHLPDDRLTRVRALAQDQPRWELYDNRNQRLWFGVNAAISPFPWLQIGGGVTFMAATMATLDISGHIDLIEPTDSSLRHQVLADLKSVTYPDFGARVEITKNLALALVYRGQFGLDLNVAANVKAGIGAGAAGDITTLALGLQTDTVDSFLPQQVVLGGSWKLSDDLRTNLDVTWVNWGAYVPPVTRIETQLSVPIPPGTTLPGGVMAPTTPAPTVVTPLSIHDTFVPHVGVEWRALARSTWEGFVRGGYEYDRSPIGAQTGSTNYVDRDRHAISAGLGVRLIAPGQILPGDVRFDVHGQLSLLPTETTTKTDPSDLVGAYTAGGHIWNVGMMATVGF